MDPLQGNVTLSNFVLVWVKVPFRLISNTISKKYEAESLEIVIEKQKKLTAPEWPQRVFAILKAYYPSLTPN